MKVDSSCEAENTDELWKCIIPAEALQHVSTPLFIAQAAVDTWQTSNILVVSFALVNTLKRSAKAEE